MKLRVSRRPGCARSKNSLQSLTLAVGRKMAANAVPNSPGSLVSAEVEEHGCVGDA